jgi:hypothetical protein
MKSKIGLGLIRVSHCWLCTAQCLLMLELRLWDNSYFDISQKILQLLLV